MIDRAKNIEPLFADAPEPIRLIYLGHYDAARCAAACAGAHELPAVRIALEVVANHTRAAADVAHTAAELYSGWAAKAAECGRQSEYNDHSERAEQHATRYRALYALERRLKEYAATLLAQQYADPFSVYARTWRGEYAEPNNG